MEMTYPDLPEGTSGGLVNFTSQVKHSGTSLLPIPISGVVLYTLDNVQIKEVPYFRGVLIEGLTPLYTQPQN